MTGVVLAAKAARRAAGKGPPRDNGDAVIALLAVDENVIVAAPAKGLVGEELLAALDLLQAEDIGRVRIEKGADEIDAPAHGIDVPGGDGEGHSGRILAWAARAVE